jgi:hypothetical protein
VAYNILLTPNVVGVGSSPEEARELAGGGLVTKMPQWQLDLANNLRNLLKTVGGTLTSTGGNMENNAPNIPIIGDIMKTIGSGLEAIGEFFNSLSKEPATKTETVLIGYRTITEQKWIREDGIPPDSKPTGKARIVDWKLENRQFTVYADPLDALGYKYSLKVDGKEVGIATFDPATGKWNYQGNRNFTAEQLDAIYKRLNDARKDARPGSEGSMTYSLKEESQGTRLSGCWTPPEELVKSFPNLLGEIVGYNKYREKVGYEQKQIGYVQLTPDGKAVNFIRAPDGTKVPIYGSAKKDSTHTVMVKDADGNIVWVTPEEADKVVDIMTGKIKPSSHTPNKSTTSSTSSSKSSTSTKSSSDYRSNVAQLVNEYNKRTGCSLSIDSALKNPGIAKAIAKFLERNR